MLAISLGVFMRAIRLRFSHDFWKMKSITYVSVGKYVEFIMLTKRSFLVAGYFVLGCCIAVPLMGTDSSACEDKQPCFTLIPNAHPRPVPGRPGVYSFPDSDYQDSGTKSESDCNSSGGYTGKQFETIQNGS